MIRYRLAGADSEVTIELDVLNLATPAKLEVRGQSATVLKIRRLLMTDFQLTIKDFSTVNGHQLVEWMTSPALRPLRPELVEGQDIVRYGGTFSQQDCGEAATYLGNRLAALAAQARGPVWETDSYEWEHLERRVYATTAELRAWQQHCGPDPDKQKLLLAQIDQALDETRPRLSSSREVHAAPAAAILDAFLQASTASTPQDVLLRFWAILDAAPL